ncbi:hypothetical protein AMTRI_Chr08g166770 [Amborella trichopoda]
MDRLQLLLVGLPLFLFCSDVVNLFTSSPPPKPHQHSHRHHHQIPPILKDTTPDFSPQNVQPIPGGVGLGTTVRIEFCTSCSYRGNALTIKKMLETSFPGIDVVLANYPPPLPKRLLSKVVPVAQVGVIAIVMAGEHIFPRLGYMTPPPWFFSLRQNRFGTIATTWLLGNVLQSFLQSSGAFELYCNDDLVFSKLKEGRFPSEFEMRDIISKKLANTRVADGLEGLWF